MVVTLTASPVPAEVVKSVGTQLPVSDFRAFELDEDRGRLYIAQGVGFGYPLIVTDLEGHLVSQVGSVTDLSDLTLSDDGATLLAAQGFDRVIAVHLDTFAIAGKYPGVAGACVVSVEPSGDKVIGTFVDCGIGSGGRHPLIAGGQAVPRTGTAARQCF